MAPYSSSDIIQLSGMHKIPNLFDKMYYTLNIKCTHSRRRAQ